MGAHGWDTVKAQQIELGRRVRDMLESKGIKSVAAPGFQAPGVVRPLRNMTQATQTNPLPPPSHEHEPRTSN